MGGWKELTPSSQFQQYGPINKYLQLKFNRDTHMVKPQALFRQPMEEENEELLLTFGGQPDHPELTDETRDRVEGLLEELEAGNISIDSTHAGYYRKSSADGVKNYPDFAVCEHFDDVYDPEPSMALPDRENRDMVRVIVEIASVPRQKLRETQLKKLKAKTIKQLQEYMEKLGDDGDRWRKKALGIALIGTEVAFVLPLLDAEGEWNGEWVVDQGSSGRLPEWDSLYSQRFQRMIKEAVEYSD